MPRILDIYRTTSINGTPYYLPDNLFTHEQDEPHWFLLCCGHCGEYTEGIGSVAAATVAGWRNVAVNDVGDDWFTHEGECPACLREMRRELCKHESVPTGMLF